MTRVTDEPRPEQLEPAPPEARVQALPVSAEEALPAPRTDRRWAVAAGLLFVTVTSMAYRAMAGHKADPDMFWHLATGKWIFARSAVPATDVFSWYGMQHGSHWLVQEWLSEAVMWAVYSVQGFPGLYVFASMLAAAAVMLTYLLARTRGVRPELSAVIALVAALGIMPFVAPRPQLFTFCLIVLLCVVLERRWFWAAPAIVLLGVNLHGGTWPLYLVIVAFYVLPKRWPVLVASAAATLVNPAGLALVWLPFRTLLHPSASVVAEFRPTTLARNPVDLVVYVGLAVLLITSSRRPKAREGLLALAIVVLSLTALRHVVFVYLLVLPLMAPYLELPRRSGATARLAPALVLGGLAIAAAASAYTALATPPIDVDAGYPKAALAYVREHRLQHVMNYWNDGGFMIFNGVPPMIDGRGEPFVPSAGGGRDLISDYIAAVFGDADWAAFAKSEGVEWVLVEKTAPLYRLLEYSRLASVAYTDEGFALFKIDVADAGAR